MNSLLSLSSGGAHEIPVVHAETGAGGVFDLLWLVIGLAAIRHVGAHSSPPPETQ